MAASPRFDLVVIGGGINGAGIARDAAMRGLSVCLLERGDWGEGTSSRSSMLAHGGLRYLEQFELGLVHEALQERERLLRHAPHLVRPLRFVYPLYPHIASRRTVRVGLWLYDTLSHGKSVPKRNYLRRDALLAEIPHLRGDGLAGGATYWDGQFLNVERLVWELVQDARRHGAACRNHTAVVRLLVADGVCGGVELEGGERIEGKAVVNAAGPWVDDVLDASFPLRHQLIRKTKGIHLVVPRFIDAALIVRAKDGRAFFFIPWREFTIIGTTDTDFQGDARDASADEADVEYLREAAKWYFPDAPIDQIQWTYAGVRPLVNQEGLTESNVTRRHLVHDHHDDGVAGLWSVQGGKLTTYRSLSEQVVDRVAAHLRRPRIRRSHPTRQGTLPGGPVVDWQVFRTAAVAAARLQVARVDDTAEHLVDTYGAQWRSVLADMAPDGLQRVVDGRPFVWAEVDHAVLREDATHLGDVLLRRTHLGLPADTDLARRVADRMAGLLGWDAEEAERQRQEHERAMQRFAVPAPAGGAVGRGP